jgi:2-dehydro-3-deoxy-D-arabinonate dehydratase
MRFCSAWHPTERRPVLCLVDDGGTVRPLGRPGNRLPDVAALVAHTDVDSGSVLEAAVESLGSEPDGLGSLDELAAAEPGGERPHLLAPVRPAEVWAAGVTYERSRDARMAESTERDVYDRVYASERPEIFLKATAPRVLGPGAPIGLRADSEWDVPEPELGVVVGPGGGIVGYTLGNDVSSRDIEGANPLYLPQAKIFAGSCALGPTVVGADQVDDPYALTIAMRIERDGAEAFSGQIGVDSLHVKLETLVDYLGRENWVAPGTVLLTGTGIVPPDDFTLAPGDVVEITCEPVGTLVNRCAPASSLAPPAEWQKSTALGPI